MLIIDQQLNLEEFKGFYKQMNWKVMHRKLSDTISDTFYVGIYKDKKRNIKVTIRPSMVMMISESTKGLTEKGKKPWFGYKGELFDFGTTIEVKIDDQFLNRIKEEASTDDGEQIQQVAWD